MRVRLVVPVNVDEPTGGNLYDLAMATALREGGDHVEVVSCAPAELAGVLRESFRGTVLVDGLLACPYPGALAGTGAGVLVHMPQSWRVDVSDDEAAELDLLEAEALEAASVVVATSRWSAQFLAERHRVRAIAVVPPGAEAAEIVEGSDPPVIVQLAAVAPHKNQLGLIDALGEVADLPWRVRLAGSLAVDPAYVTAVRRAIESASLNGRVELTGVVPRDAAFAGADLLALPSLAEAYGMVVTEALARGIPAVVAEGGPAEALGVGADGLPPGSVVPRGDTAALAAELRRWLSDPDYRGDLRQRALACRPTLDGWDVAAQRLREALRPL
jgi:glycosyltransferase involved in cell wall biosynthesis